MMKLINKTRITDNLSVLIGQEHIDVIATETFPFDVQIRFVKTNETQLDNEEEKKVFTPEYQIAFAAVYKENKAFFKSKEEINTFTKQLKEIKELFKFATLNKQTWFDTAMFNGVLSQKVGSL
ncbi:hypothetical protein [Streptococcus pluranimalium]|uniref:hypothetical protein n=1 Tax=Streptococcus pluranimalium TaxID=82348 RepID=UPI0039EB7EED